MNRLAIRKAPSSAGVHEVPLRAESRRNTVLEAGDGSVTTEEVVCELVLSKKQELPRWTVWQRER